MNERIIDKDELFAYLDTLPDKAMAQVLRRTVEVAPGRSWSIPIVARPQPITLTYPQAIHAAILRLSRKVATHYTAPHEDSEVELCDALDSLQSRVNMALGYDTAERPLKSLTKRKPSRT